MSKLQPLFGVVIVSFLVINLTLIGEAAFSIRVTALLGYLDLVSAFWRTLIDLWSSISFQELYASNRSNASLSAEV